MESLLHAPLITAANDGVLPTDVLRDVLLRLPADALCRLRLVCRSWRSLTSDDPIFAKDHSSRHPLVVRLRYCVARWPGDSDCEVQFVDPLSGGIVKRIPMGRDWNKCYELSAHHRRVLISRIYGPEACVLNPATGLFTMLPTTTMVTEHENKSIIKYASVLGWVPSTSEYKALRIRRFECWSPDHEPEQSYHVATLGVGGNGNSLDIRWRVQPCPPDHVSLSSLDRAVVKGVAYFLLHLDHIILDEIAALDLATEEWRHPPLQGPHSSQNITAKEEDMVCFSLANLNECLVSICDYQRAYLNEDYSMDLWFLVDADKEMWTKRYSLQSASVADAYGSFISLWILDDGRVLIWVDGVDELRAYDPRTSVWTKLSIVENLLDAGMYDGSLLR